MKMWFNVALALGLSAINVLAAGAGILPWERPMQRITDSLTGPTAFAVGITGFAMAGGTLLMHGDLGEFGRKACVGGMACSCLVMAPPLVTGVYGVTGALV